MGSKKRLRIFAGPNGSGKTTLVQLVRELGVHLGVYVNADDIKVDLDRNRFLDFDVYSVDLNIQHLRNALEESTFYSSDIIHEFSDGLTKSANRLEVSEMVLSADFFPSFLADYLRTLLLADCAKFTFETVMSHPSKLEFIRLAKETGFRIYLYFVSLEDPILNIGRVEARVRQGGHDVPTDKIVDRYERTMNYLLDAIRLADRAYLFDNSYLEPKLFAVSDHSEISLVDSDFIPSWFQKYVIDRL